MQAKVSAHTTLTAQVRPKMMKRSTSSTTRNTPTSATVLAVSSASSPTATRATLIALEPMVLDSPESRGMAWDMDLVLGLDIAMASSQG